MPLAAISRRKKPSHIEASVYWKRPAVGVKVEQPDGAKPQKFYFSRVFNSIAVNILQGAKMADLLRLHPAEFMNSEEAAAFYKQLQVSAGAAADDFAAIPPKTPRVSGPRTPTDAD